MNWACGVNTARNDTRERRHCIPNAVRYFAWVDVEAYAANPNWLNAADHFPPLG